jgi:hypothetical protein
MFGSIVLTDSVCIWCFRNPKADGRPTFSDITQGLLKSDFFLLKWSAEDIRAHTKETRTVGAPLELGRELYEELQSTYVP